MKDISPCLLDSCSDLPTLQQIHASLLCNGTKPIYIAPKLITRYANFNDLRSAVCVFKSLSEPNTYLWNLIMKTHVDSGFYNEALRLYCKMRESCVLPDGFTFPTVNRAISLTQNHVWLGQLVHGIAIQMGFGGDLYFCNTLIELYVKKCCVGCASQVFDEMRNRDLVSWTSMISGYVFNGDAVNCFRLFREMQLEGLEPNSVTLLIMLRACNCNGNVFRGKEIHGYVIKKGFESNGSLENSILKMYSKTCSFEKLENQFNKIINRDVVSWNIMISTFSCRGNHTGVAKYFTDMQSEVVPNLETLTLVTSAFARSGNLRQGEQLHCYVVKTGLLDVILQTSLVDLYAKCGKPGESVKLFNEISKKNSVTLCAMMSGFIQNGYFGEAITLFLQFQFLELKPEVEVIRSLVDAYTQLGTLRLGQGIHGFVIRNLTPISDNGALETSILNMYAKCGSITYARRCFDRMDVKDVIAWTSMIEGYGSHGLGVEALEIFSQMEKEGVEPNKVTVLSLLSACCHSGLVNEGYMVFNYMSSRYGIKHDLNLYTSMVDLLSRSGKLDEALEIIEKMAVKPDGRIWGALLAASRVHSNAELGIYAARQLLQLEQDNAGCYTLLSSLHASTERWDEAEVVRRVMNEKQMKKKPGWSCIEAGGGIHGFVAGDETHPQVREIFEILRSLSRNMEVLR